LLLTFSVWSMRSSMRRSFFPNSCSAIYNFVLNLVFSSLNTLVVILYRITSSYKRSRS
jgi:hypothetical protein